MKIIRYSELEENTKKSIKKIVFSYIFWIAANCVNTVALWLVMNILFVMVNLQYLKSDIAGFVFSFVSTIVLVLMCRDRLVELKKDFSGKLVNILNK